MGIETDSGRRRIPFYGGPAHAPPQHQTGWQEKAQDDANCSDNRLAEGRRAFRLPWIGYQMRVNLMDIADNSLRRGGPGSFSQDCAGILIDIRGSAIADLHYTRQIRLSKDV